MPGSTLGTRGLPVHEGSARRAGEKAQVHGAVEPPLTIPPTSKQRARCAWPNVAISPALLDRNHYPHFTNKKVKQLAV